MNQNNTCIVLAARMQPCGTLDGIARDRLFSGLILGVATGLAFWLATWFGLTGWTGLFACGLPALGTFVWPALTAAVTTVLAMRRIQRDTVIDESLAWTRRVDAAAGVVVGETPPEYQTIRPWPSKWTLWASLPMGWIILLALLTRDVRALNRICRRWPKQQRRDYRARAAYCLAQLASAIDDQTLCPASGTWFGCHVHPQSHAVRSEHILNHCFGGLGLALVPGLVWLGTMLAGMGFGYAWGVVAVTHFAGAVAVWFLGVARVRLRVALAWERQAQGLRYTLRAATSERDAVTRLIEDSTWEANGLRLADHWFLGWVQPAAYRPWHPLKSDSSGQLSVPTPLFIPPSLLNGHVYISGSTGSFKTSAAIAGLLQPVLAGVLAPVRNADGRVRLGIDGLPLEERSPQGPVLVLDLKGDLFLKNLTEETCLRNGRRFQFMAIETGAKSACFNPIKHLAMEDDDALTLADATLACHGLNYGVGYGLSYFFTMNRTLLMQAYQNGAGNSMSYTDLVRHLTQAFDPKVHQGAFEVVATLSALATHPLLQSAPPGGEEIDMDTVVKENAVVYAWLPLSTTAFLPRDVMRLLLYAFCCAMKQNNIWKPKSARRAHVFIDEAQALAGMSCDILFQQARSLGINLILANQSLADLNSRQDPMLSKKIETNTRTRIHFTVPTVEDRERAIQLSRETLSYLVAQSVSHTSSTSSSSSSSGSSTGTSSSVTHTTSYQPNVHPALNVNDLLWLNNTPGLALVEIMPDAASTRLGGQPTPVYIPYAVSQAEYERLSRIPLERKPVAAPVTRAGSQPVMSAPPTPKAVATHTYDALATVYRQLTGRSVNAV